MVRHPGLKLKIPAQLFCMSWCPDFEFLGTQGRPRRIRLRDLCIAGLVPNLPPLPALPTLPSTHLSPPFRSQHQPTRGAGHSR